MPSQKNTSYDYNASRWRNICVYPFVGITFPRFWKASVMQHMYTGSGTEPHQWKSLAHSIICQNFLILMFLPVHCDPPICTFLALICPLVPAQSVLQHHRFATRSLSPFLQSIRSYTKHLIHSESISKPICFYLLVTPPPLIIRLHLNDYGAL